MLRFRIGQEALHVRVHPTTARILYEDNASKVNDEILYLGSLYSLTLVRRSVLEEQWTDVTITGLLKWKSEA